MEEEKYNITDAGVKRLAEILAIQAEVEGMIATNTERERNELALAYDEKAFKQVAEKLRTIASKHDEQL